jgi:hypothetical protein
VLRQPCLVCGRVPSDPHHLTFTQPRALGRRVSDEFIVPVCRLHHGELHRSGDEVAWWQGFNIDPIPASADRQFRDDPAFVLRAPSAPAPNPDADIDTTPLRSVNYMVNPICEPISPKSARILSLNSPGARWGPEDRLPMFGRSRRLLIASKGGCPPRPDHRFRRAASPASHRSGGGRRAAQLRGQHRRPTTRSPACSIESKPTSRAGNVTDLSKPVPGSRLAFLTNWIWPRRFGLALPPTRNPNARPIDHSGSPARGGYTLFRCGLRSRTSAGQRHRSHR